jgi:hypothetical protein
MPFSLNRSLFMQRDRLLISEIVDAAQRIVELTDEASDEVSRLLVGARLAHLEGSVSR